MIERVSEKINFIFVEGIFGKFLTRNYAFEMISEQLIINIEKKELN